MTAHCNTLELHSHMYAFSAVALHHYSETNIGIGEGTSLRFYLRLQTKAGSS